MTVKVRNYKAIERKFVNGFVVDVRIKTNKAGGVRIPIGGGGQFYGLRIKIQTTVVLNVDFDNFI